MVAWCIGMDITAIAFHVFTFDHWVAWLGAIWCFNVLWMVMMMMEMVMSIIDHFRKMKLCQMQGSAKFRVVACC